jgi:hypothetical protein
MDLKTCVIVSDIPHVSELVGKITSNIALGGLVGGAWGYVIFSPAGQILMFTDASGNALSFPAAPAQGHEGEIFTVFGWVKFP